MEATATQPQTATKTNGTAAIFERLKGNALLPILIGGAAFIGLVFALVMWANAPEYRVLYSNLTAADGGSIVNELETRQIPYQLNGAGNIMVPADQVARLRMQLAEQGLPAGGNAGFSLMDNQAFGISQFAEQVNYQRALEGELASTMESLGPVAKARVHLALAKASVFVRDREPAKASVVLTLQPGRALGAGQVQAVIHMVSSSVPELGTGNVTVVDQYGNLLSQQGQTDGLSGSNLDYIEQLEQTYQQRIESILAPILGRDNIQAEVVATVDFSKREATAERYTPNQNPDTAAIRSIQRNTAIQGGGQGAQGIPGALSNTPPGVAASPVQNDTDGDTENNADTETQQNPSNFQQDQVVNYEVDRIIEHIEHERGQLQRLSVAVVIDHRYEVDENGVTVAVPRTPEEIDYIQRLVRQAVGYNVERGDQIEVVNSQFVETKADQNVTPWWQQPATLSLANTLVRYLLAALGVFFAYRWLLRPLLKRYGNPLAPPAAAPTAKGNLRAVVGDNDATDDNAPAQSRTGKSSESGRREEDEDELPDAFKWPEKKQNTSYTQALSKAKEQARSNPKQVARILQNWMSADDHA